MFDRVNDLSGSLTGNSNGEVDLDAGPFAELLEAGEKPQYALASDSVDHVTDGRTTTVQPDGNHDAYLVVTDERLLIVLGDQPDVVEIDFDFESVAKCNYRSGFLNSKLVVGHEDEEIHFSPTDGDVKAVEEYVDRVADVYRSIEDAISTADGMLAGLEAQIREAGTEDDSRLRMQSHLSDARHQATHFDVVPSEKLLDRIESARAAFDRRYITAWLDRGQDEIDRAQSALEDGDFQTTCQAAQNAAQAISTVEDEIDDVETTLETGEKRIEKLADQVDALGETYEEAVAETYESASAAEGASKAAQQWLTASQRLQAIEDTGWQQEDRLPEIDIGADRQTIAAKTVEALEAHAAELEATGEECEADDSDRAREHYEQAADRLKAARDVADQFERVSVDDYEQRLTALEEKIERSEWQWGGN